MHTIETTLKRDGLAVLRGCGLQGAQAIFATLGTVIQRERVALRAGAHAYLAKPGEVPLHTDHPAATWVAWYCETQDHSDGSSWLLDARPVLDALPPSRKEVLRRAALRCPPVSGGPATLEYAVLSRTGEVDRLFCSPWLHSSSGDLVEQSALDALRASLKEEAQRALLKVSLQAGDVLIVDNGRVLHGRGAIAEHSPRVLHRSWIKAN